MGLVHYLISVLFHNSFLAMSFLYPKFFACHYCLLKLLATIIIHKQLLILQQEHQTIIDLNVLFICCFITSILVYSSLLCRNRTYIYWYLITIFLISDFKRFQGKVHHLITVGNPLPNCTHS